MGTYVALIRGIGPGDPRKSNESLRGVLTELGFTGVRSVISSGNVVFETGDADADAVDSAALGDRIEAAWPELRGFTATTIVLSRQELERVIEALPFGDLPHGRESYQLVTFFKHPAEQAVAPPDGLALRVLGMAEGAMCTVSDTTVTGTPDAMKWIEGVHGKEWTSRTPLTLQRILRRM
jgi:uncharacterized protein (DUF1697 family)